MCFRVWEKGFGDGGEVVAKRVSTTLENKTCIINLSLLVVFVNFITFSSYPTISKE
jgi:hypothetical protein